MRYPAVPSTRTPPTRNLVRGFIDWKYRLRKELCQRRTCLSNRTLDATPTTSHAKSRALGRRQRCQSQTSFPNPTATPTAGAIRIARSGFTRTMPSPAYETLVTKADMAKCFALSSANQLSRSSSAGTESRTVRCACARPARARRIAIAKHQGVRALARVRNLRPQTRGSLREADSTRRQSCARHDARDRGDRDHESSYSRLTDAAVES